MIQKSALLLSLVSVIVLASVIISCGGSSSLTPTPTPCTGAFNVVGDWQGSITSSGTTDALFGTIDSTGNAVFFDASGNIATLNPITGACSFSSTLTAYESVENGGPQSVSGPATGNVTSSTAINGSESVNGTGTFSFSSYSPLGSGAATAVSGTAGAEVEGQTADGLILTLSGTSSSITYSGSDAADCSFNGAFTQQATNNLYSVTFNISGSNCTAGNLTGVGFESDSDLLGVNDNGSGTYLYAVITSSGAPFVVEVLPSGASALIHSIQPKTKTGFSKIFAFGHRKQ